jgi:hypothetical protein
MGTLVMKKYFASAALCLLALSGLASAADMAVGPPNPAVDPSGFFVGLGGSYNSINFGTQHVYAVGTSDVYSGGALVASGSAAGPTDFSTPAQSTFAPVVQLGYFQHFGGSDWLWGAKFAYSYLDSRSPTANVLLPQTGSYTSGGTTTPFTGNALVNSYETSINHQLSLMLFVGRSFGRGFVYFGGGPTVSQTQTSLYGVTGFADLNGAPSQITGTPTNLSSSGWVPGGALTLGATYFLDPTWFLDFSYTYSMTANQTSNYGAPFTNLAMTEVGTLTGNSSEKVTTQAVAISINKTFFLGGR